MKYKSFGDFLLNDFFKVDNLHRNKTFKSKCAQLSICPLPKGYRPDGAYGLVVKLDKSTLTKVLIKYFNNDFDNLKFKYSWFYDSCRRVISVREIREIVGCPSYGISIKEKTLDESDLVSLLKIIPHSQDRNYQKATREMSSDFQYHSKRTYWIRSILKFPNKTLHRIIDIHFPRTAKEFKSFIDNERRRLALPYNELVSYVQKGCPKMNHDSVFMWRLSNTGRKNDIKIIKILLKGSYSSENCTINKLSSSHMRSLVNEFKIEHLLSDGVKQFIGLNSIRTSYDDIRIA